jgi:hypothetical protein
VENGIFCESHAEAWRCIPHSISPVAMAFVTMIDHQMLGVGDEGKTIDSDKWKKEKRGFLVDSIFLTASIFECYLFFVTLEHRSYAQLIPKSRPQRCRLA